jgi:D-beta-D-heptose 7-phosphate kinase/D-beta-D-heptose 1-phosphate adenosyltransferase
MTELNTTPPQRQYRVLLIGDDCTDIYQYGTVDRLSPEAPVPIFKLHDKEMLPGMAGNVKRNLEALGVEVHYLHGLTSTKTRLIDIKSKQHIVRIDNDVISDAITFDTSIPEIYDAIVISDYDKGTVSYELIEEIRKDFTGPIFIDTKKTYLHRMEGCIVKINSIEYIKLDTKCSDLIVTYGKEGVVYKDDCWPAYNVQVSDVTGAGDTFLSALTYAYLNTKEIKSSIPFAIQASSVTVQYVGVYAPSLEEIENENTSNRT